MKIRECLVSNSSSSSFVIIGKELHSLPEKISDKKIYLTSDIFCGEGDLVIKLTQEIADFICKNKEKFNEHSAFTFYDALMELTDDFKFKSNVEIPKGSEVFVFNRDNCSPKDLKTFKEMCENII